MYLFLLQLWCGVSSLIGSQESEPTSWFEVPVPPRFDNSDHLIIEKKENGSVFIAMDNNDKNHRCKVRYLALSYIIILTKACTG